MDHGLPTLFYVGHNYIKRAFTSNLLETYETEILKCQWPIVHHFALGGGDECIELVTPEPLQIVDLHTEKDKRDWIAKVCDDIISLHEN